MTSTHAHEVKAKDPERAELQRQLEEWRAAGGIPEIVTSPPRQSQMAPSQEQRNAMTWENRK